MASTASNANHSINAITGYYRPIGLEPVMGKIAAGYSVSLWWSPMRLAYQVILWHEGSENRTGLYLDARHLQTLRDRGDYDLIWNLVRQTCREATDEMANLHQLADEAKRA